MSIPDNCFHLVSASKRCKKCDFINSGKREACVSCGAKSWDYGKKIYKQDTNAEKMSRWKNPEGMR